MPNKRDFDCDCPADHCTCIASATSPTARLCAGKGIVEPDVRALLHGMVAGYPSLRAAASPPSPALAPTTLDEIERLAKGAWPGPWIADGDAEFWDGEEYRRSWVQLPGIPHEAPPLRFTSDVPPTGGDCARVDATAEFIATCSPERILALLTALRSSASALAEAERELNETTLLLQKVTAALNTALDDETQALFHYQAGYTAGHSHGRRQEPQRGEESARAFVAPRAALAPGHPEVDR